MTSSTFSAEDGDSIRRQYLRPIYLAIGLSLLGELGIWFVWGLLLFPGGSAPLKLIWLFVCGLGMGAVIGSLTSLLVVGRLGATSAFLASAAIAFAVYVACDILCFRLDQHYNFWGTRESPTLFLVNGIAMGLAAAVLYASLLFSHRGRSLLQRLHL